MVQAGSGEARMLGFPTINIPLQGASVSGIFAARVIIHGRKEAYDAAAYADTKRGVLEAHLLDFHDDVHATEVRIELLEKIRESERFDSEAALYAAIAADVEAVRAFFTKRYV